MRSPFLLLILRLQTLYGKEIVTRECEGQPRHVHLAVGRDPSTSMTVSFASILSHYSPPKGAVLIGESLSDLNTLYVEADGPTSYNLEPERKPMGNYMGHYYSPHYHHVEITGLKPATTYYYKPTVTMNEQNFKKYHVRRSNSTAKPASREAREEREERQDDHAYRRLIRWGPYNSSRGQCPSKDKIRSFRTASAPGTVGATFAIIGDMGQFPPSEDILARVSRDKDFIDAAVLAGDISYAEYNHKRWDTFFDFLDDFPFVDRVPMQVVAGNHDIDKGNNTESIFLAYEHRFRMPRYQAAQLGDYEGPPGRLNMDQPPYPLPYEYGNSYYAWKYAGAHFIMVNPYASMEPNSTQYAFLDREFQSVDRDVTPWLIVVIHIPLYNSFSLHQKDPQIFAAQEHLEPLLVRHGVNVVLTGHIHAYQRTAPVAMGEIDPKGPIHITVGAGGRECKGPFKSEEAEPWVEVRDATVYGYGVLDILNRTHCKWTWIHTSLNEDNRPYNLLWKSNKTLPGSPPLDQLYIRNQHVDA